MKRLRLAVLNSHPIQYFAPLYAYLNRNEFIDVTALYCSDFSMRGAVDPGFEQTVAWDLDLLAGYRSVFLGTRARSRIPSGFWSLVCPEVWTEIRSNRYDALLLHGYNFAVCIVASAAAKTRKIPVLIRSETHLGLTRSPIRQHLRDGVLRIAYRFVDGFFAIGTANRDYYRHLGVPESKIYHVPYTVDNDRFIEQARVSQATRSAIRKQRGLPAEGVVIIYASKFMRRKHPDDVLRAVHRLGTLGLDATLLMVGSGEMESELRKYALDMKMANVVFLGFINQSGLPRIYAAADVFVLPTESEPWGLIVNEVMCAGLPVVVSSEVGCVPDLVKDGANGFQARVGDVDSLVSALRRLLEDEPLRKRMGDASLQLIRQWSYRESREGILVAGQVLNP